MMTKVREGFVNREMFREEKRREKGALKGCEKPLKERIITNKKQTQIKLTYS